MGAPCRRHGEDRLDLLSGQIGGFELLRGEVLEVSLSARSGARIDAIV